MMIWLLTYICVTRPQWVESAISPSNCPHAIWHLCGIYVQNSDKNERKQMPHVHISSWCLSNFCHVTRNVKRWKHWYVLRPKSIEMKKQFCDPSLHEGQRCENSPEHCLTRHSLLIMSVRCVSHKRILQCTCTYFNYHIAIHKKTIDNMTSW